MPRGSGMRLVAMGGRDRLDRDDRLLGDVLVGRRCSSVAGGGGREAEASLVTAAAAVVPMQDSAAAMGREEVWDQGSVAALGRAENTKTVEGAKLAHRQAIVASTGVTVLQHHAEKRTMQRREETVVTRAEQEQEQETSERAVARTSGTVTLVPRRLLRQRNEGGRRSRSPLWRAPHMRRPCWIPCQAFSGAVGSGNHDALRDGASAVKQPRRRPKCFDLQSNDGEADKRSFYACSYGENFPGARPGMSLPIASVESVWADLDDVSGGVTANATQCLDMDALFEDINQFSADIDALELQASWFALRRAGVLSESSNSSPGDMSVDMPADASILVSLLMQRSRFVLYGKLQSTCVGSFGTGRNRFLWLLAALGRRGQDRSRWCQPRWDAR
eukprot:TRINITY_DN16743_c0_g1_i1.p1 TRINITY_DN16743_c0_g1~~TRINITY_DN16743_c0_g1_i1.p1  ORF type:complete len:429 (-),score=56.28 TRINITY_DN16743_c0_g1_i1:391-1557(-)